jgi:amyloid beta A4 precursor protein-binding family B protein 1-interacting protein
LFFSNISIKLTERIFEDHENLVEAMSNWSRDNDNQIIFTEKTEKYDLFLRPEVNLVSNELLFRRKIRIILKSFKFYLMNEKIPKRSDEQERIKFISEFFQNIGSPVPEIEGPLYLKGDSKKWKKYYCVLRQSGLYYTPKGKNKVS